MRTDRASRTAQHNALFRALDARRPPSERIADDRLAVHFLPLEFRILAEIARVPAALRAIEKVIDGRWPGPRSGVVVRTRMLDDAIFQALPSVDQVLILGAGLDTRAHRLPGMGRVQVFEVDHPSTQATKKRAVHHAVGAVPDSVRFVPVEFGRDDVAQALAAAGFCSGLPTLVLWEGVTNYLSADAVDATFRFVASTVGAGSPILFTYVDRDILDGSSTFEGARESRQHVERVGEPYTFGFDPAEVAPYLAERGIRLVRDVSVSEAAARFHPAGQRPKGYAYYHVVEARTN